jgi:hypothetical protein
LTGPLDPRGDLLGPLLEVGHAVVRGGASGHENQSPGEDLLDLQRVDGDGGGVSLGRRDAGGLDSVDIVPDMGHSDNKLNFIPSSETAAGGTIFSGNWACTCSINSPLSVMPLRTCFCQVTVS